MEAVKVNNDAADTSPVEAGFFAAGSAVRFSRSGYKWVQGTQTRLMKKYPV